VYILVYCYRHYVVEGSHDQLIGRLGPIPQLDEDVLLHFIAVPLTVNPHPEAFLSQISYQASVNSLRFSRVLVD
jgi:hypothetical protein